MPDQVEDQVIIDRGEENEETTLDSDRIRVVSFFALQNSNSNPNPNSLPFFSSLSLPPFRALEVGIFKLTKT
jgi:hypothetical protein